MRVHSKALPVALSVLVALAWALAALPLAAQPKLTPSGFESVEGRIPPGSVLEQAVLTLADGTQKVVTFARTPDGKAMMEGDITLTVDTDGRAWIAKEQTRLWAEGAHLLPPAGAGDGGSNATGISGSGFRWGNNTVPFVIEVGSAAQESWIEDAMDHIEARTAVRFVPRSGEGDFLAFVNADGVCRSPVGRQGGRQEIELDLVGCGFGQIVHEIGHSLGLWHEQSRQDRDSYVIVHWNNIQPNACPNFDRQPGFWRCPYDFDSIMNYGSFFFAIDPAQPTLTRLDGSTWVANRTALTSCDGSGIADMYPQIRTTIYSECFDAQLQCSFYANSIYGVRPVTSYTWTIEDGSTTVIRTTSTVNYQFQSPGTHYVFLEVVDSQGDRASAMATVDLDPSDPCIICTE